MARINDFFHALDGLWKPVGREPIPLEIIGSAAIMLQCDGYDRGTKDSDVLESRESRPEVDLQLRELAGDREKPLFKQNRFFIDIVQRGIPFLPTAPVFNAVPGLTLKNFVVTALHPADIAVSKLKLYRPEDSDDIRALADRGLLEHGLLVKRFLLAAERFSVDARAEDVPGYLKNLRKVERDILAVEPAALDLPPQCEPD
ncbi:MAG: hypothetical protein M0D55_20505 [Elusimicrobiota bacterium]|nr:MAG: hypothetical protein M0D55_20505 [Elusimicrobiota bacterium]